MLVKSKTFLSLSSTLLVRRRFGSHNFRWVSVGHRLNSDSLTREYTRISLAAQNRQKAVSSLRSVLSLSTASDLISTCQSRKLHHFHSHHCCNMAETNGKSAKKVYKRLPEFAVPSHYTITLKPDLAAFTFEGESTIDVKFVEASKFLRLNQGEIVVSKASLKVADQLHENLEISHANDDQTVDIRFPSDIPAGSDAKLNLTFTGILNDRMHGFYRSKYTDDKGNVKHMATCQFESTYARFAFPCWDEPIYKATFDIVLRVSKDLTALSNMDVKASEDDSVGGFKRVSYNTTPKMSSYLVAFIVGEFDYVESKTNDGVIVRVYTLPGKQEQGRYALDVGVKALNFYVDFFNIKYPLPKSDLIAIPDFSMGAMENWGLVTYREVYLLVDPAKSSAAAKAHIALIVGHELAHMWFGNLVTMKWWTDLWLKEGFATFMEYLFVGENYPEFAIWMQFVNDEISRAFNLDALKSSHPIEVQIENPNELEEIYDGVTYSKSCSVIRMLYHFLGRDTFQKGTRNYLDKFQYSNAITTDLWKSFSDASGQDVAKLMAGWTAQMGFPLVTVESEVKGTDRVIKLKQKRFLADGSEDAEKLWRIPINISTKSKPNEAVHKVLLSDREQTFTLNNVPEDEYIKLNVGLTGLYRVEYSKPMLDALLPALSSKAFAPVDRFNLINDVFALTQSGQIPAKYFLEMAEACAKGGEDDFNVWSDIDVGISMITNVMSRRPDDLPALYAFVRRLYSPIAEKLGWEPKDGEDIQTGRLRSLVQGRLAKAENESTVAEIRKLFTAHISEKKDLNPDLRNTVYGQIGRHNGQEGLDQLMKLYESSDFSEVQRACLLSMGACPNPEVHKKALQYAMDKVRSSDLYLVFNSATSTKAGQESVLSYFKENYDSIVQKYGGCNSNIFQAIVKMACRNHASDEKAKEIEAFFADKKDREILERPIAQSLENVKINAKFLSSNGDSLAAFLKTASA